MHRNVLDLSISTSHGFRQCTIRKYECIRPDKVNYLILRHFYSLMRLFPPFFLPYKKVKKYECIRPDKVLLDSQAFLFIDEAFSPPFFPPLQKGQEISYWYMYSCLFPDYILINTFDDLYSPFRKKKCLKKEGGGPEKQVILLVWP